jgi:hypothetical protein
MTESAISTLKQKKRDKKPKESFGWDIFNTDSLYKAYEKRINKLPKLLETSEGADRKELMAKEIEERIEKRNKFSRVRP